MLCTINNRLVKLFEEYNKNMLGYSSLEELQQDFYIAHNLCIFPEGIKYRGVFCGLRSSYFNNKEIKRKLFNRIRNLYLISFTIKKLTKTLPKVGEGLYSSYPNINMVQRMEIYQLFLNGFLKKF